MELWSHCRMTLATVGLRKIHPKASSWMSWWVEHGAHEPSHGCGQPQKPKPTRKHRILSFLSLYTRPHTAPIYASQKLLVPFALIIFYKLYGLVTMCTNTITCRGGKFSFDWKKYILFIIIFFTCDGPKKEQIIRRRKAIFNLYIFRRFSF